MTLGGVSTRAGNGAHDPFGSPAEQGGRAIEHDLPGAVTADLADYLAGRRDECADIAEEYADAVDDLTRFVLAGGKRLRPDVRVVGLAGRRRPRRPRPRCCAP